MAENRKPAGWKTGSLQFWEKPDGRRRCKECLRDSTEGAAPATAHERKCSAFPAEAIVRGPDLPRLTLGAVEQMRQEMPEHPIDRAPRSQPKPRPRYRSGSYLDFIRALACCSCGAPGPSDPHHWSATVRRGVGQKLDDLLTVPLCRACHDTYHRRNALPGQTKEETTVHLLGVQVELLVNWIAERQKAERQTEADRRLAEALDSAHEEI